MGHQTLKHEYQPTRKGRCGRIIGAAHCGLSREDGVHWPETARVVDMEGFRREGALLLEGNDIELFVCLTCGAVVMQDDVSEHSKWHERLRAEVRDAESHSYCPGRKEI